MKKVNLLNSLSASQQYEIQRWFWCSIALFSIVLCVNTYFILPKFIYFNTLKKELVQLHKKTQNYSKLTQQRDALKKEYEVILKRNTSIEQFDKKIDNLSHIMDNIFTFKKDSISLESMSCAKKEFVCNIAAKNQAAISEYINYLSSLDCFSTVKLVSLHNQNDKKMLQGIIKGNIVL